MYVIAKRLREFHNFMLQEKPVVAGSERNK